MYCTATRCNEHLCSKTIKLSNSETLYTWIHISIKYTTCCSGFNDYRLQKVIKIQNIWLFVDFPSFWELKKLWKFILNSLEISRKKRKKGPQTVSYMGDSSALRKFSVHGYDMLVCRPYCIMYTLLQSDTIPRYGQGDIILVII